jgi:hypothetical protein
MYLLLAIAILCLFALPLAALAVGKHVRSRHVSAGPQANFAHHLFAAVNDQDSGTPRTLQQNVRGVAAETSSNCAPESIRANTSNPSISSKHF